MTLLTSCAAGKYASTNFTEPIVKTYDVSGTKDELFLKSNLGMVSAFKDARSVIQYSDKAEGILTGKYLLHYFTNSWLDASPEYALIEIRTKDGKVRISVTPDNWKYMTNFSGTNERNWNYTKEMALADIDILCESFHKSLQAEDVTF
jgi:hypothetical protein